MLCLVNFFLSHVNPPCSIIITSALRQQKTRLAAGLWCAPREIRTLVLALKGLRPGPLDDGGGNG